ncbi:multiple sugar transport system permease protein [Mesorhizobium soli]|uniref:carbohydrate ABC transporter permease n=1 Tax=Pseudaminobacter soli (ex Li et al. 2025) TaxID=1295366 RepID=UPI0024740632|nr:sugar ABC transporter permease [Mesorhizobium soli]MDH6231589.1 multiple sugar transport system permease protein [Mesorhizobium soli]
MTMVLSSASIGRAARRRLGAEIAPSIAYWFAAPSIILLVGTMLLPIVMMIAMSLTDYELGALDFSFVGFNNYLSLWGDKTFWRSLLNTAYYVALVVPASVIIGLVLAVMVNGLKRGRKFYQIAFFLPVTSTLIAMATVWKYLLHGKIGPVNHLLTAIGLPSLEFFGDPSLVMPALAIIGVWSLAGFNMVLFTAGLTAIPQELYEASAVDGIDNPIERFFTVTLPMLGPTTMFVIITTSITAFKVFDTVAVLTRGGPQGASDVLLYVNYLEGFQYMRIGLASAITVVFLGIILLLSLVQAKVLERKVHY